MDGKSAKRIVINLSTQVTGGSLVTNRTGSGTNHRVCLEKQWCEQVKYDVTSNREKILWMFAWEVIIQKPGMWWELSVYSCTQKKLHQYLHPYEDTLSLLFALQ